MVPRSIYLTVDFSYLTVINNKKLVTATGEQRQTISPPLMELLAAESCVLYNNKGRTVGFRESVSMIRERDNMWQIYLK